MTDVTVTTPVSMMGAPTADGVNAADESGRTGLHYAAQAGNQPLTVHLIEAGADREVRTRSEGHTPLHLAAAAGHAGLLALLITPSTLDAPDHRNETPLQLAVRFRRLKAASVLVAAGASLGGADFASAPLAAALQTVGQCKPPDMPLLLLNAMMADPGSAGLVEQAVRWQQAGGVTALHTAASWGHCELVAKLVEAGADRDAVTQLGATPLWCAAAAGHAQLVPLLASPTNINLPGPAPARLSPLHQAVQNGQRQVVEALLSEGAAADTCDHYSGQSALGAAVQRWDAPMMDVLVRALEEQHTQQQQQQQGQATIVQLLAAAYLSVKSEASSVTACSQLLEVVLDLLGPGVAGDVCQAVQKQLQEALQDPKLQPHAHLIWLHQWKWCGRQVSYLAEALLLGWVAAEERLHAARQPLVTRLQRLVLKQGPEQQQERDGHGHKQQQQPAGTPLLLERQLKVLLQQAALAAGKGQQQEALRLLGEFAAMHFRRQECKAAGQSACGTPPSSNTPSTHSESSSCLVCAGLHMAATSRMVSLAGPDNNNWDQVAYQRESSFHPPGVYTTFLVAWGRARHQLQQLPQKVAGAVVAAVEAAQQQQQQQQQQLMQQEQQGLDGEEEALYQDLLALLLLPPPLYQQKRRVQQCMGLRHA